METQSSWGRKKGERSRSILIICADKIQTNSQAVMHGGRLTICGPGNEFLFGTFFFLEDYYRGSYVLSLDVSPQLYQNFSTFQQTSILIPCCVLEKREQGLVEVFSSVNALTQVNGLGRFNKTTVSFFIISLCVVF